MQITFNSDIFDFRRMYIRMSKKFASFHFDVYTDENWLKGAPTHKTFQYLRIIIYKYILSYWKIVYYILNVI